jgi:hypothetical protein
VVGDLGIQHGRYAPQRSGQLLDRGGVFVFTQVQDQGIVLPTWWLSSA